MNTFLGAGFTRISAPIPTHAECPDLDTDYHFKPLETQKTSTKLPAPVYPTFPYTTYRGTILLSLTFSLTFSISITLATERKAKV
jgi:hypothetical protein